MKNFLNLILKNTNDLRSLLNKSSWTYLSLPFTIVFGLINTGILTRALGVENFGLLSVIIAITGFISGVFNTLSSEAITTFVTPEIKRNKKYASELIKKFFSLQVISGLLTSFTIFIFSGFLLELLGLEEENKKILFIHSLSPIFGLALWNIISILRIFDKYSYSFFQSISFSIVKACVFVFIYLKNGDIINFIYSLLFLEITQVLVLTFITKKVLFQQGIDLGKILSWPVGFDTEIKSFLFYNLGRSMFRSIGLHADVIILSVLSASTYTVGLYKGARKIQEVLMMSMKGFESVLYPEYTKIYHQKGVRKLKELVFVISALFIVSGILICCLAYLFSDWIIQLILGSSYEQSISIFRLLLVHSLIVFSMMALISIPRIFGESKTNFLASLVNVVMLIIISLFMVPLYSINGLLLAIITGSIVSNIYIIYKTLNLFIKKDRT
tara:strand:+ start:2855 stop:4180 length:1326 start_codon:yes stop_codon:yes gene_type:complete